MSGPISSEPAGRSTPRSSGFRVWHLCLLTAFSALAIVNIQEQRRSEPVLIGLAVAGFVLYAILGWGAWRLGRRLRSRMGLVPLLALYLAAMGGLFLVATVIYLAIEHVYLIGL
jgi:hypothetical protein